MKKALAFFVISVFLPAAAWGSDYGGVHATPTVYQVTVTKIELRNTSGTYVTLAEGSFVFDIASVTASSPVGAIGQNASLPAGTYDQIRVTFSRTFSMRGSVADAGSGQPARTATGNGCTTVFGALTDTCDATTDGAAATTQSVRIPDGAAVTTALATAGMTEVTGGLLRFTQPVSFTISPGVSAMPSIKCNFDVTNTIEFETTGVGTAVVAPRAPGVTISVTN